MRKLIELAVKNSFYVNLVGGTICLLGILVVYQMKRDLIPPLEFPSIEVSASLPGASPSEIESMVTFPIEEAIGGVPGLKKTKSYSRPGYMQVRMDFEASFADRLDANVQLIRDRITGIQHRLPSDLRNITVRQDRVNDVYLATFSVKNMDELNPDHRAAVRQVQSQISSMRGISNVQVWMGDRNLFVRLMPEKLKQHNISVGEVRRVLNEYFRFQSLGTIRKNGYRYSIQMNQPEMDVDALKNMSININSIGQGIRLKDIARIEWDKWQEENRWLRDGEDVAVINVRKDTITDSIKLYDDLLERVDEIKKELPDGLAMGVMYDGPRFIKKQISVLSQNGWLGLIFVICLLTYFLGFKVSMMAIWGLPVAYLGTFIVLSWFGIAIDLLSILGIILVVGIIVDDAIIVAERYTKLHAQGLSSHEAATVAARELIVPVTGTVITTIVAFLPILLIEDNLTWFLKAIPLVVIVSMIFSWLESFFILPNHLAHFVKSNPVSRGDGIMKKFEAIHVKVLRPLIKFRYVALVFTFAFIGLGGWIAAKKLQHHFNISVGSEQIWIRMAVKESESLDETQRKIWPIIEYAKSFPDELVEYSSARLGRIHRDGVEKKGYRYARIVIGINGNHPRPIQARKELLPKVKEALKGLKTDEFEFLEAQERKRGEEGRRKNTIAVRIEGVSEKSFLAAEKDIVAAMKGIVGLNPKQDEKSDIMEQWIFSPDYTKLAQYGITRSGLAVQVKEYISPYEIGQVRVGGESVSLLTEMVDRGHERLDQLAALEVSNRLGEKVPLGWLGQWNMAKVKDEIVHRDGKKHEDVAFKYDEKHLTLETAKESIAARLAPVKAKFKDLFITAENANTRDEENKSWTMKVVMYSLVGVFVVLALFTKSLLYPFLVMAPAPLGMMGAFIMLFLHDNSLTIMGMIGLMGVIGVSVNDSIVLLHQVLRLRDKTNWSYKEVLIEGTKSRLRAIMLTSITTLGGLFPTAYGFFGESGFTQPITFTMGWGLFFSTLITVTLLPCYLMIVEDVQGLGRKAWNRIFPQVQPQPVVAAEETSPDFPNPRTNPSETERPRDFH